MQGELNEPIYGALDAMRATQDAVSEARSARSFAKWRAELGRAERALLKTAPQTIGGVAELLLFVAVEIQCDDFDKELVASAINRCVTVLEGGTVCNS